MTQTFLRYIPVCFVQILKYHWKLTSTVYYFSFFLTTSFSSILIVTGLQLLHRTYLKSNDFLLCNIIYCGFYYPVSLYIGPYALSLFLYPLYSTVISHFVTFFQSNSGLQPADSVWFVCPYKINWACIDSSFTVLRVRIFSLLSKRDRFF